MDFEKAIQKCKKGARIKNKFWEWPDHIYYDKKKGFCLRLFGADRELSFDGEIDIEDHRTDFGSPSDWSIIN